MTDPISTAPPEVLRRLAMRLASELDAMRLARAEDHKACARLAARVKELEAALAEERAIIQDYRDGKIVSCPQHGIAIDMTPDFAEGTRDETAPRCRACLVPVPGGAVHCPACGEAP